jgi:hypothetical protein
MGIVCFFKVAGGGDNLQHIQVVPISAGGAGAGQQVCPFHQSPIWREKITNQFFI